jgi:hypothetical protein
MKLGFALAALALGGLTASVSVSSSVGADEATDYAKKVRVAAKRDAGKLSIKLVPDSTWFINTEYPIKCTLKVADGGKLDKAELKKDDAKFEESGKAGKAKSVSFETRADKAVEGECKLVICTESSCSSPFKVAVKSN